MKKTNKEILGDRCSHYSDVEDGPKKGRVKVTIFDDFEYHVKKQRGDIG